MKNTKQKQQKADQICQRIVEQYWTMLNFDRNEKWLDSRKSRYSYDKNLSRYDEMLKSKGQSNTKKNFAQAKTTFSKCIAYTLIGKWFEYIYTLFFPRFLIQN